jgi:hypothetical protein
LGTWRAICTMMLSVVDLRLEDHMNECTVNTYRRESRHSTDLQQSLSVITLHMSRANRKRKERPEVSDGISTALPQHHLIPLSHTSTPCNHHLGISSRLSHACHLAHTSTRQNLILPPSLASTTYHGFPRLPSGDFASFQRRAERRGDVCAGGVA